MQIFAQISQESLISEDNLEGGGNSKSTHGRDRLQTLQGRGLGREWGGTEGSQLSEWLSV